MARQRRTSSKKRGSRRGRPQARKAAGPAYYLQPGKRGAVVLLHRAVGNRATPKVCGVMPTKEHAQTLMDQLLRAEGAVRDLFYEATDDGIEALEAVLLATWTSVLEKMPPTEGSITAGEMAQERERIQRELDARAPQRAVS